MVELLIPIARRDIPEIFNAQGVPLSLRGQFSGAFRGKAGAKQIGDAFGRDRRPVRPILLYGPDERTVIILQGGGEAEAAELEELAIAQLEKAEANVKRTGNAVDFAMRRERRGDPPKGQSDALIREALWEHHKKNKTK